MNIKNQYYLLRHGFSRANEQGLIVSDMINGGDDYGLAEKGCRQVRENLLAVVADLPVGIGKRLISSPFLRTRETAAIAGDVLGVDDRLKERFFGDFELQDHQAYSRVWALDRDDPHHTRWRVESVMSVYERVTELVQSFELQYAETLFILVTHGDAGQILECFFRGHEPARHRELKPLQPGELRRM